MHKLELRDKQGIVVREITINDLEIPEDFIWGMSDFNLKMFVDNQYFPLSQATLTKLDKRRQVS